MKWPGGPDCSLAYLSAHFLPESGEVSDGSSGGSPHSQVADGTEALG